jgi:hypothetical protein
MLVVFTLTVFALLTPFVLVLGRYVMDALRLWLVILCIAAFVFLCRALLIALSFLFVWQLMP